MIYTLIKDDYYIPLLYDNGILSCECNVTDSRPMIERKVKIHKGVDNQIKFQVLDSDRRKIGINQLNITAVLVDTQTHERVLKKPCRVLEIVKGQLVLTLFEGDLYDIAPGNYELVITGQQNFIPGVPGDQASTPFYSDTAANIRLYAEVIDSVDKTPPVAMAQEEFIQDAGFVFDPSQQPVMAYFTSAFPGHRTKNLKNMIHTIAVYPEIDEDGNGYTGFLRILGTLDQIPSLDNKMWYTIPPDDYRGYQQDQESVILGTNPEEIYFDNITEPVYFVFTTNSLWVKCAWVPVLNELDPEATSKISKILYL